MWATSRFPSLTVTVKGIQHFSHNHSKNSADMAIAMDAVADFVTGEAEFIAVMSDDSDFMPVFAKLKDMASGRAPFLWLVTDRVKTRSNTIEEYFPGDHIHTVKVTAPPNDMILLRPADDSRSAPDTRVADARTAETMRIADNRVLEEMGRHHYPADPGRLLQEHRLPADNQVPVPPPSNIKDAGRKLRNGIHQQALAPPRETGGPRTEQATT